MRISLRYVGLYRVGLYALYESTSYDRDANILHRSDNITTVFIECIFPQQSSLDRTRLFVIRANTRHGACKTIYNPRYSKLYITGI